MSLVKLPTKLKFSFLSLHDAFPVPMPVAREVYDERGEIKEECASNEVEDRSGEEKEGRARNRVGASPQIKEMKKTKMLTQHHVQGYMGYVRSDCLTKISHNQFWEGFENILLVML